MKLSATPVRGPGQEGLPPPLLGQHTEEVLTSVLGWDAAKLAELKSQKII
jgi:crotonobetainyl-CoA:carnitine CoA-transferase CaiB-like acyl-CoA transferase